MVKLTKLDIEIVTGDEEAKIIRDNHVREDTIIVPTMGLTDGIINELVEKTLNNR